MKLWRSREQNFFMACIAWGFACFAISVVAGKLLDAPTIVNIGPLFLVMSFLASIGFMTTIFEPGERR